MRAFVHSQIVGLICTDTAPLERASVTLGHDLLIVAGIDPGQQVTIINHGTGIRWESFVLPGRDGVFVLNGPDSRKGSLGDECSILAYEQAEIFGGAFVVTTNLVRGRNALDDRLRLEP